ncbi:diguanylate cyclase [Vibrio lentus]|nr:diguanylate cyclase [Vibrio lentus]
MSTSIFFKVVNDTYGHQMGDVVLKVANVLSPAQEESSWRVLVARSSFFGTNKTPSCVEDKFMTLLQEMKKITLDRKPVTISIGACHFELVEIPKGKRMSALDSLIKVADECLYIAKQNGRISLFLVHIIKEHSGS